MSIKYRPSDFKSTKCPKIYQNFQFQGLQKDAQTGIFGTQIYYTIWQPWSVRPAGSTFIDARFQAYRKNWISELIRRIRTRMYAFQKRRTFALQL
jgi:hypothetical protein